MKRFLMVALITGLVAGAALDAGAAKRRKPVATTLYLHGAQPTGELSFADNLANSSGYQKMDKNKPGDGVPKSMAFLGPTPTGTGPNTGCAGNDLFPLWTGDLSGTVVGDLKLRLHTVAAAPGQVEIRVWPDVAALLCDGGVNSTATNYPSPVATLMADIPAGHADTIFKLKNKKFRSVGTLMVQITPLGLTPAGRVLYDSTDFTSSLSFKCIPASGKKCA